MKFGHAINDILKRVIAVVSI